MTGGPGGPGRPDGPGDVGPDLDEFIERARELLSSRFPAKTDGARGFRWGEGSDSVAVIESRSPEEDERELAATRRWAAERFAAGFGWIDGPPELGGSGLTSQHRRAYRLLERSFAVPDQSFLFVGSALIGPTLLDVGDSSVISRYLPGLHDGRVVACQLFSEPDAGSDLANVRTRAERDGGGWRLTGHKVWTSNAHLADVGLALCRTDPEARKHHGITAFMVDLRVPGVEVRPIRQMAGGTGFNEVFLDGVWVPDEDRVGEVGKGWTVALTTLAHERASLGEFEGLGPGPGPFERIVALADVVGRRSDPLVRDRLASVYTSDRLLDLLTSRLSVEAGERLSMLRLVRSQHVTDVARLAEGLLGPALVADTGEWGTFAWSRLTCGVPGSRIGGGTDEVVKNVLAERVLGLPREPRPPAASS